jgi:hypothetical protein
MALRSAKIEDIVRCFVALGGGHRYFLQTYFADHPRLCRLFRFRFVCHVPSRSLPSCRPTPSDLIIAKISTNYYGFTGNLLTYFGLAACPQVLNSVLFGPPLHPVADFATSPPSDRPFGRGGGPTRDIRTRDSPATPTPWLAKAPRIFLGSAVFRVSRIKGLSSINLGASRFGRGGVAAIPQWIAAVRGAVKA